MLKKVFMLLNFNKLIKLLIKWALSIIANQGSIFRILLKLFWQYALVSLKSFIAFEQAITILKFIDV